MTSPPSKLFGTDGVRGVAGGLLSAELALELGRAATDVIAAKRPQVLIVRDTRESGQMLESALAAGVAQAEGDALVAGILPTPAASILVRRLGLDLAAVISASHNPWRDNGIKFFSSDGRKLDDELERRIEESVAEGRDAAETGDRSVGRIRHLEGALDDYLRALSTAFAVDLEGRRIVLDCANGATHRAGPAAFRALGAQVEELGVEPDGRNINEGCGSTHPELLAARVVEVGAELGFAFDGDGDRVIAVDSTGRVRDGDELIALAALHLRASGSLAGDGVAVTVMSNYGFHQAMEEAGIAVATTPVGDRNVSKELEGRDWSLGGEQSGHIIWREFAPTGDGIAAALLVSTALDGRDLATVEPITRLPQLLRNLEVPDRAAIDDARGLWDAVQREKDALEGRGRVLVRASGTEPLLRVMVEAPAEEECEAISGRLLEVASRELGAVVR